MSIALQSRYKLRKFYIQLNSQADRSVQLILISKISAPTIAFVAF